MTYIANWLESHSSVNLICVRISLSNFVERYINQNRSHKRELAQQQLFFIYCIERSISYKHSDTTEYAYKFRWKIWIARNFGICILSHRCCYLKLASRNENCSPWNSRQLSQLLANKQANF
jgi:hypothetical protein